MSNIEERFKSFIDRLTFMELKSDIESEGIVIKRSTPLPILKERLTQGILSGDFNDEIGYQVFLEGMFFYVGISNDLPNVEEYRNIINLNIEFATANGFNIAVKYADENNLDYATMVFRGIKEIDPDFYNARYNLGLCYERYALRNEKDEELFNGYFDLAFSEMESIIADEENYPYSYYKLGYYHRYRSEFLKAREYWDKFLTLSYDDALNDEISEERLNIYDDSLLEGAIKAIDEKKYGEAISLLDGISQSSQIVEYYFAESFKRIGRIDNAIIHYEKAIEIDSTNSAFYNDLAILYFDMGNLEKANEIYTKGITLSKPDYKLYFNRGLVKLHLGKLDESYDDIKMAHDMNPDDEQVLDQYNILENYMKDGDIYE